MELTIRTGGADGAERLPALVRLRNWLFGPPEGTRLPPKGESDAEAHKRQQIDTLTPEGLALQISNVLWAQRGSLKVDDYNTKGIHSTADRRFHVEIPGGIRLEFGEECTIFTVTSPDGEVEEFGNPEADRIGIVWRAIQAMAICDVMGVDIPSQTDGIRPNVVIRALNEAVCAIVERSDPPMADATYRSRRGDHASEGYSWDEMKSKWKDLGCGVFMDATARWGRSYRDENTLWYRIMTEGMGVIRLRREPLAEALERRKRSSFANALGITRALPVHLPMPSGNAQAARVLRLCREAVAREPDLVDAKGTRIAPLVEQHLPRLMQKHAEAARIAEASELAAIDAELMQGIELVRQALEEALTVSRVDKREALRTELAFLEYRHPVPSLLSLDAVKDPA
jgi:hypothetical protein